MVCSYSHDSFALYKALAQKRPFLEAVLGPGEEWTSLVQFSSGVRSDWGYVNIYRFLAVFVGAWPEAWCIGLLTCSANDQEEVSKVMQRNVQPANPAMPQELPAHSVGVRGLFE